MPYTHCVEAQPSDKNSYSKRHTCVSYEVLEAKIKTLPAEYIAEVYDYVEKLFREKIDMQFQSTQKSMQALQEILDMPKKIPVDFDYKTEYANYLEEKYGSVS